MNISIYCTFKNKANAERAFSGLREIGVNQKDISVIMKDETQESRVRDQKGDNTARGATAGGVVGGLAGLLIGISTIILPGIGAIIIGGPIVAALGLTGAAATTASAVAGGVAGVLAGGLVGGLIGLGLPEESAKYYEGKIKKGDVFFYINANRNEEEAIKQVLEKHKAMEIQTIAK